MHHQTIHCILCARPLLHAIEDEGHGERAELLLCDGHTDDALDELGFNELWPGARPGPTPPLFDEGKSRLVGAWEQGRDGAFGVYLLLDDGLLLLVTCALATVYVTRVPSRVRALAAPTGVAPLEGRTWLRAVRERWTLRAVDRRPGGGIMICFAEGMALTFATEHCSWRTLGDGRHFLLYAWERTT